MEIKAVKFRKDGFYGQPFAFGGEEGPDKFDIDVRYRGSLQNYLIDTGDEVILVDTGLPAEFPDAVPDDSTMIYMGNRIQDYVSALAEAGYAPEQVTKILVTHKHDDHTGELRAFPNAKVYIGPADAEAMGLGTENIVRADYADGPYYNFPASQKVAEGVYLIEAKGHTLGNSIIIAECGELYFMFHGDVTYTDEALYMNKLSVVFEDAAAARTTLDAVREFIRNHPTVYLSTHTPLGYENLEAKRVVDLDHMPEPIPPQAVEAGAATGKYVCSICGYVYDPAEHDGEAFEALPDDWKCPRCRQGKEKFNRA